MNGNKSVSTISFIITQDFPVCEEILLILEIILRYERSHKMKIQRTNLENCGQETDTVVVIDVLRAFTTDAVAFAQGAQEIIMAGTTEELFALAEKFPEALTLGETRGVPIEGIAFGNSPAAIAKLDLTSRRLIHKTTCGTPSVIKSAGAKEILTTSLCCASATAAYLEQAAPYSLTFVESGVWEDGWGDEDRVCADLIAAKLSGQTIEPEIIKDRVINSHVGKYFLDENEKAFPIEDLAFATDIDRYDFVMKVFLEDGLKILRPIFS